MDSLRIDQSPAPPATVARRRERQLRSIAENYAVAWICLILFLYLSVASNAFLTHENAVNLLDQWSTVGIIACAGTFVLISRMFDLSVGAIYALAGVVAAHVAVHTGSAWLGFGSGVLVGGLVGLGNGLAAAIARINPFVVTLATSLMVTGIAVYISHGLLITVTSASFTSLGQGTFLSFTVPGLIFAGIFAVSGFVLARTTYGRRVTATGGNPEAARLSGIRVAAVHISVFVVSGLAAGLAGVLAASRVGSGEADVGTDLPLLVIAVVVVGGTSIFGGEGAMWRTLLGVLLYAMVRNGFSLLNINDQIQQVIQGAILLIAVGIDASTRKTRT